ncbi:MAG: GC-type dockerin domain-anchored protein [Phycisphaerales bacterium]
MSKGLFVASFVASLAQAALAQSPMQLIAVDGGAAPGFLGSSLDLVFNDQSATNSLPQLAPDGTVTFRARAFSTIGGTTISDSWWITREGSYQVAAYLGGLPSILQVPAAGQFGRMYVHSNDGRVVADRGSGRFFEWIDQRWVAGFGVGGFATTLDGAPWTFITFDTTNVTMPRADLISFVTRLPPLQGAAGPAPGFVAGWNGTYSTVLGTGRAVPGNPGQTLIVPDSQNTSEIALGRSLRMNASGRWVARVGVQGTGVTSLNNSALWRGALGEAPTQLVRCDDPAPGWPEGQGARIAQLSRASINGPGHIAFIARVSTMSPTSSTAFALYVERGSGLELVARTGTAVISSVLPTSSPTINAPWTLIGAQPGQIAPPVIGDDGTVGFVAVTSMGEATLALRNGQVHEMARRDMVLPRTGGRVSVRPFNQVDGQQTGATGMAIAANGDVLFSVPLTGNYDPRITGGGSVQQGVLSWRPERGVRAVACPGMFLDGVPGARNRVINVSMLGDGNNRDGVPTGAGFGSGCALYLGVSRTWSEPTSIFQAVVLSDLGVSACGIADIAGPGAGGGPDGELNNNDFIVFIDRFFAGDLRADYGKVGGVLGFDDRLDNNDFVAFIGQFFAGCG